MENKVVKHRNYFLFYFIMILALVGAVFLGMWYYKESMNHTTVIEKGINIVYNKIGDFIQSILK